MESSIIHYSFIIPHHNTPDLLNRLIDSIPDRSDIQIIVVDDNSDMGKKPSIVRKGVEIITLDATLTKGAGRARNIGLEQAKGKWMLFADADDYYKEGFLDILDKELDDNCDILYFNIFSETQDSNDRANKWKKKYDSLYGTPKEGLIRFSFNEPWYKAISSELVFSSRVRFEERPSGNDVMFSLNISAAAKKPKYINEQLYCLTSQPGSIVHRKRSFEHVYDKLDLSIAHDVFNKEHGLEELRRPIITWKKLGHLYKEYGVKNTIKYLKKLNKYTSIVRELLK